jgi:hypothetical protein
VVTDGPRNRSTAAPAKSAGPAPAIDLAARADSAQQATANRAIVVAAA